MTIGEAFIASARTHWDKPAVFWGDAELPFRHFASQAEWVANRFQELGLKPGDRVGIWLKNCPEFISSFIGIFFAGGVAVPINNFLKPEEVVFIARDAGLRILVTDQLLEEGARTVQARIPGLQLFYVESIPSNPPEETPSLAARKPSDLAVIIYTSGTTGYPKGAMLTHNNLLSNVRSCQKVLEAVDFDRFVLLLPMFHSFMLTVCVLLPLTVGGSIVLIKSLHPPKAILQEVIARAATILPAIPQLFRTLAHTPMPVKLPVRLCVSGAAPLPGEILKEFTENVGIPLLEGYGLSEASPVVSLNPIRGPWKAGSIGLPIDGVEVSVQNEAGDFLPDREVGEICVRGPNVMEGYWNQPEETAKALRDGWLLTGDIGYRDADGYFYITDRKKDMLLVNGINVYPREIEEVLYQFPGIREAGVIGKQDSRRGEQPVAFVSAREGSHLEEKEILQFVRDRLADYKVPRRIIILPALPRNATGKILKTELRNLPT